MYQYLTGQLIEKSATEIILDVNGVGYLIQIPLSTHGTLPAVGETVRILTHFVVREDAHLLFGFHSEEERSLFRQLISVSGIGPKMGLTILSGMTSVELKRAIVDGSVHLLTGISGIGRKTAERIVVELREKIVVEDRATKPAAIPGAGHMDERMLEDSVQALVQLGYRKQNAKDAIQKVLKNTDSEKLSLESLIRESLKYV